MTTATNPDVARYSDIITWSLPAGISSDMLIPEAYSLTMKTVGKRVRLSDIITEKIRITRSLNTRRGYETFLRYFISRYGEGPWADTVNQNFINGFADIIEKDYPDKNNWKNLLLVRLATILNMAMRDGFIPTTNKFCFPKYKFIHTDHNLSEGEIAIIYDIFCGQMLKDPHMTEDPTLATALFILDIAFQGLAPVDLSSLRISDIRFHRIYPEEKNMLRYAKDIVYRKTYDTSSESMETVLVDTFRKKTGQPVKIVACLSPVKEILSALIDGKSENDYLIPCFYNSKEYTPEQRQARLSNFFHKMSVTLNREISRYYLNHELGKCRRVTFYHARHAFCNLADNLDLPRHIIRKMVGHRQTVLERNYLRPATQWEQAMVTRAIFDRLEGN